MVYFVNIITLKYNGIYLNTFYFEHVLPKYIKIVINQIHYLRPGQIYYVNSISE